MRGEAKIPSDVPNLFEPVTHRVLLRVGICSKKTLKRSIPLC